MKHIYLILTVLVASCQPSPDPTKSVPTVQQPAQIKEEGFEVKIYKKTYTRDWFQICYTRNNWKTRDTIWAELNGEIRPYTSPVLDFAIDFSKQFETYDDIVKYHEGVAKEAAENRKYLAP